MKPTAGYAKGRARSGRITAPTRKTRLNLQRRRQPKPDPEEELDSQQRSTFWKWVLVVALFHVILILVGYVYYEAPSAPKPPEEFISLLPPGDTVKGTPGAQQAHKLGIHMAAAPHHAAPPPPASAAPTPPRPVMPKTVVPPVVKTPPPPIVHEAEHALAPVKPPPPKPAKPVPPKPKVKVDLHLVDRAENAETAPKPAKHHPPKPVKTHDTTGDDDDDTPDSTGLSKQQIAEKLGDKLNASGTRNAEKVGASGAPNGSANRFQEFYELIAEQVHDEWNSPNVSSAVQAEPLVHIHVERDGRIAPGSVYLERSSGDPGYDQTAIETVKRIGQLREPLPEGCPPDITINFNPNP
ncbi:MAG: energy transducer TonB [Verrucomicrobiota bacterium]